MIGIKEINIEERGDKVLVYQKERSDSDVQVVTNFLDSKDIDYDFLKYGTYSEADFDRCLKSCSRAIIVGRPETQGIAYQEMMSSGMPLLLWEVDEWYDMGVPEFHIENIQNQLWHIIFQMNVE